MHCSLSTVALNLLFVTLCNYANLTIAQSHATHTSGRIQGYMVLDRRGNGSRGPYALEYARWTMAVARMLAARGETAQCEITSNAPRL
jgi:hypothetical protein